MDYKKIDKAIEQIGDYKQKVIRDAGLSPQGYYKMIKNKSMRIDVLEDISRVLGIQMSYWWEEDPGNVFMEDQEPNGLSDEERKMYQDVIKNLNKIIKDNEERLENFDHRKRDGISG